MWNNDEDLNECGEPVELYLPVRVPARKTNIAPQDSHIGGLPCFDESFVPCCDVDTCGDKMFLLSQLRLQFSKEMERYLCTFACPKEECFRQISFDKGFASSSTGLKGVVKCIEKRVLIAGSETKAKQPIAALNKSSWYDDNDDGGKNDDDWGGDGDGEGNIDLENAVAAMEGKLDDGGAIVMAQSKKISAGKTKPMSSDEALQSAYGCYLLTKQLEPASSKSFLEDEDDVGLSEGDDKIRNMLARYMAEEEDEDILAALGGTSLGGGGGGNNGEEDERLSEEDRVLRSFQDRQKRLPRQVIRCASGGQPLWSIPDKNRKSGKTLWSVPESFKFEFQVLPSVLAKLEVDQHPITRSSNDGENAMALDQLLSVGVNFGSIAVFTNPAPASFEESGEQEAFVVIQKSVDDLPVPANNNSAAAACGDGFPAASMAVVEDLDDDEEFELDA